MLPFFRYSLIPVLFAVILPVLRIGEAGATSVQTNAEKKHQAWQQLSGDGYVFANAGVAFFDTKLKSRSARTGTISFTSNDKDETGPAMSVGFGVQLQRYFAFEVSYHYIPSLEYSGSISASNANIDGNILDGNMTYEEEMTLHGIGLTFVTSTYDVFESFGMTLRAGGYLYDMTDEFNLAGSGTLGGSAITTGNNKFEINTNGATWTAGASLFYAPTLSSRLELRYDYVDGIEIEDLDKVSVGVASLGYRYRF